MESSPNCSPLRRDPRSCNQERKSSVGKVWKSGLAPDRFSYFSNFVFWDARIWMQDLWTVHVWDHKITNIILHSHEETMSLETTPDNSLNSSSSKWLLSHVDVSELILTAGIILVSCIWIARWEIAPEFVLLKSDSRSADSKDYSLLTTGFTLEMKTENWKVGQRDIPDRPALRIMG